MAGAGGSGGRRLLGPLTQLPTTALLCQPQELPSALQWSPLPMGLWDPSPWSLCCWESSMAVLGLG